MAEVLEVANNVLEAEIAGLEALKTSLTQKDGGEAFEHAVSAILGCQGKIVVTGVGKSGHVGRKITATFASTGTNSTFIHPTEASHGDLGAIRRADIVLALSKSGETHELDNIISFSKRFEIPIIAMTGNAGSHLASHAAINLIIPSAQEACKSTRAPTTSTTMMMALGDALAVSLLNARGFTADDFLGYHPGGILGGALRRVGDLMDDGNLPVCDEQTALEKAVTTLENGRYGCVGICSPDGRLAGIITDGDLRRHFQSFRPSDPAKSIMTASPHVVTPQTLAGDALAIMNREKITALFVVDNERPVGLLHVHHCLAGGVF